MSPLVRRASYTVAALGVVGLTVWAWPSAPGRSDSSRAANATAHVDDETHASREMPSPSDSLPGAERSPSADLGQQPTAADTDPSAAQAMAAGDAEVDDRYTNRSVEALMARLSSTDAHLVLDAADGLRARRAVEAIPKLASLDVVKSPDAARTVIDALGELAGVADPANRKTATDRLIALLAQEKNRHEPDALGNVLQLYEALGKTGDPRAATVLEQELADPSVSLAALSLVVASLMELGQPSSPAALAQARTRVAAMSFEDALEAEIQAELLTAIDAALARR